MIVIAFLFPGLSFILRGKILNAIIAFVLQIAAIPLIIFFGSGFLLWLILAIWAINSLNSEKTAKAMKNLEKKMIANQSNNQ